MKKRALILALAGIMAASLTGCGSLKDDAVVVKQEMKRSRQVLQISMQDIHRLSTKHTLRIISAEMICGRKCVRRQDL